MKYWLAVLLAGLCAAPSSAIPDEDCLEHGESVDLEACRPPLNGPGMPVTGEWVEDAPGRAFDEDVFSHDPLGGFDVNEKTGCGTITITNSGGSLHGPNGMVANGWADGNCIEVYATFLLRYQVTIRTCHHRASSVGAQAGATSVGISEGQKYCEEVVRWTTVRIRVTVGEVCAC